MPIAKVNGIEMYYEQSGEGPDLVLISGLSVDHSMWETKRFTSHYRVTVFDNRGVGQSSVPEGPYSIEQFADDAHALCISLGIEQADVVGHSMGGHITQQLAILYPKWVRSAVLANSEQVFSIISDLATRQQLALMEHPLPQELLVRNYLPTLFSSAFLKDELARENYVRAVLDYPYPTSYQGYREQVFALRGHDTRNALQKIECPTLVLGSDGDLLTPPENSRYLAAHIAKARLVMIPDCGHVPFIEKPDAFYQAILDFLREERI